MWLNSIFIQIPHEVGANMIAHGHTACKHHGWDDSSEADSILRGPRSCILLGMRVTERKAPSHLRLMGYSCAIYLQVLLQNEREGEGQGGRSEGKRRRREREMYLLLK